MAPSGNYSGQHWRLVHHPSPTSSTYALYTQFLGANKRLDVYGDDKTKPHLADAGNYSGQIWTLTPWGDGTWKLTNEYSGSGLHIVTQKIHFWGMGIILASIGFLVKSEQEVFRVNGPGELQVF